MLIQSWFDILIPFSFHILPILIPFYILPILIPCSFQILPILVPFSSHILPILIPFRCTFFPVNPILIWHASHFDPILHSSHSSHFDPCDLTVVPFSYHFHSTLIGLWPDCHQMDRHLVPMHLTIAPFGAWRVCSKPSTCLLCWAEARVKIARMTLTIKLDGNWSSFQLANSAPPLSVTDSAIAPSARIVI